MGKAGGRQRNSLSSAAAPCLTEPVKLKVDTGIWSRLTQAVALLIAAAVLLLVAHAYLPVIQQNERMRRDILRLDAELQKQAEISRQLNAEMDALRNDPATIERLAREKLGYARADETVIRFEPATNSPTSR